MYSLYLDDLRNPKTVPPFGEWVIARSYDEAVQVVTEKGLPDYVSFDHDLGDETTKTGYDVCKWLVKQFIKEHMLLCGWNVHSANPVGARRIDDYMRSMTTISSHQRFCEQEKSYEEIFATVL